MIENLPAMRETQVPSLGQLDCPEKRMAAYSSILSWRIPWIKEWQATYSPWVAESQT